MGNRLFSSGVGRYPKQNRLFAGLALLGAVASCVAPALAEPVENTTPVASAGRPNILFIAVDDLRPDLGAYGNPLIHSPYLDRLAERGMLFNRAYCQQSLCAPSRSSLLSGLRPSIRRPGINAIDSLDDAKINQAMRDTITLPQHLRQNGYATLSVGKIFHKYSTQGDDAWDRQLKPGGGHYQLDHNKQAEQLRRQKIREEGSSALWRYRHGDASEAADAPDGNYQTHQITTRAIRLMRDQREAAPDQPFFLAVGYYKPHLPFVAPQRYWDLYDREAIEVPPIDEPEGVSEYALVPTWYEMRAYGDIPQNREHNIGEAKARKLIHGYYACISFVDAQVGRLMAELDKRGLADNTVVIVWGDHGFKLGDYGDWSKYTNLEIDTRVPLIVHGPGVASARTDALVELIDLYPTVTELAGVPTPEHVEATSFVPLLSDPHRPWKKAALSYYDRENPHAEGLSIRDARFRYTEWRDYDTGDVLSRELYDHAEGSRSVRNLVEDPGYADTAAGLARMLRDGWALLVPDPAASAEPVSP